MDSRGLLRAIVVSTSILALGLMGIFTSPPAGGSPAPLSALLPWTSSVQAQGAGNGALAGGAQEGPIGPAGPVTINGPWYEFDFAGPGTFATACTSATCAPSSAGNSVFADSPPWTFTAPLVGVSFRVTDAFLIGDRFEVFDGGTRLGLTSVPGTSGSCGSDPAVCFLDPLVSKRTFALGPGPHSITIRAVLSPSGSGAAYFRVTSTTVGPPPNDDFANAQVLTIPDVSTGTNRNATVQSGEPAPCFGGTSVWFDVTSSVAGLLVLHTRGSDYDTTLAVLRGTSVSTLVNVVCNDDFGGTLQSQVAFDAVAGVTYHVRLGGFGGSVGNYRLEVARAVVGPTPTPTPTPAVVRPPNDNRANAQVLAIPTVVTGSTRGATNEPGEGSLCGGSNSVWSRLNSPEPRRVIISTRGSTFDTTLALYRDATELVCNDDAPGLGLQSLIVRDLLAGVTYHLRLAGFAGQVGDYRLEVAVVAPTPTPTPTPPPVVGVRVTNFVETSLGAGNVALNWRLVGIPARLEVVRFNERGLLPPLVLAPTATSTTDLMAVGEGLRCHAVQAKNAAGAVVAQSELGCVVRAFSGGPRTISITYIPGTTRAILTWAPVAGATYGVVPLIPRAATITTTDTSITVETGGDLFCALVVANNLISDAICGLVAGFRIPTEAAEAIDGDWLAAVDGPSAGLVAARRQDDLQ